MEGNGDSPGPEKNRLNDPPPSELTGTALERAHDHAVRLLERDATALDAMRTRVSFLIAALTIGGTVLGAILASTNHKSPPLWVVIWLWLAIIPCIAILWSTRDHGHLKVRPNWIASGSADWRLTGKRSLTDRWGEWRRAPGENRRLWKVGLGADDLSKAQLHLAKSQGGSAPGPGDPGGSAPGPGDPGGSAPGPGDPGGPAQGPADPAKEPINQVLVERMYAAHEMNDHTLTRRADLFRVASALALVFFILFISWLLTTHSSTAATNKTGASTTTAKNGSSTSTATPTPIPIPTMTVTRTVIVTPTVIMTPTVIVTVVPIPTEPGRG